MKTNLFFFILSLGIIFWGCKKEVVNVYNNYYHQDEDSMVLITSPKDSSLVYDTVPIGFYVNKSLNIIRTESYLDFAFLEGFDSVPPVVDFYTTNLEKGSLHHYYLRIIGKDGRMFNSNIITIIISKLVKPVPEVTFLSKTSLQLTWDDHSNDEEGYHVFRKEGINDSVLIGDLPKNSSAFIDNYIDTTKSYVYWVEVYSSKEQLISDPITIQYILNNYMPYKSFPVDECADGKIAITPDATRAVVTNYFNDNFTVINLNDGSKTYLNHNGGTLGLAMSHNGHFFVTGGTHGSPDIDKVWDLNTLTQIGEIHPGWSGSFALCINKSDENLVVGGEPIKIFTISDGTLIKNFNIGDYYIRSITFSSDETVLLSGGNDDLVKVWDVSSGTIIRTFSGHTGNVGSVCFNLDESQIYSGSYEDQTIKIWDKNTGQLIKSISRDARIVSLHVRDDGDLIVGESNGTLMIMTPDGQIGQEFGSPSLLFHFDYNSTQDLIAAYSVSSVNLYTKIGHWELMR